MFNIVKTLLLALGVFIALSAVPLQASKAAEVKDFSSLLAEVPDAKSVEDQKPDALWGIKFEGELRANLWYQYSDQYQWKTTNRLDLKGEKQIEALKLLARLKLDYQNLEEDPDARIDPREAYAQYRFQTGWFDYLDFTAGKKILYWGKGDEIRPTDIANPEDLTSNLYYLKNERKTGVLGLFVDWALNQTVSLEVFWSPYFQKSWSPSVGSYFEPHGLRALTDAGIPIGSAVTPDQFSDMASAGGRLKFSVNRFDIDLYAYQGYSNLPTYMVTGLAAHPLSGLPIVPTQVSPEYLRVTMYGADFERAVGDFVLRGEVAWLADGNRQQVNWSSDPGLLLKYPSGTAEAQKLQYLLGVDKNDFFIRHLYVNVQYVGQYLPDYENCFTDEQVTHGMTLSVQYSLMDSTFKFREWLVSDFTDHTYRNLLEGTYKINNWSEVSLGIITYYGDANTLFGQYDNNDFVYTQLKFIF